MRDPSDHTRRLMILNLNRKVHCVRLQLKKLIIDVPPGHTIQRHRRYRRRSLFVQWETKFLPGRSRRVSFVANLVLFNVHKPKTKPMTMPIFSLDLCCVSPIDVIHLLHHVIHSRYSIGGSLRRGSLRMGSLGSESPRGVSL